MQKSLIFLVVFVSSLVSCKKEEDPKVESLKNLVVNSSIDLITTTIAVSGGQIQISKPGTAVDGLKIDIPANAFASEQHVKVSFAEIRSHDLGPFVNPISPLINIRMDGGYANEFMRLTIPVVVPEGHIPIGFYYDGTTGKLEGIPLGDITPNSITLLTRHFSARPNLKSSGNQEQTTSTTETGGANILISSISESILNGQAIIASGFKPGTDDWEFANYGSYLSPEGNCLGQTLAALWYYFEKKPTGGKLFDKFSELPNIWQENARGYRFCSVLQQDGESGIVAKFSSYFIDMNQELDRLKFSTIAAAILVTGEPQSVIIFRQTGTDDQGEPTYVGHALICYQVSMTEEKLYISDPNTPATGQTIRLTNNRFEPYQAKLNDHDAANPYPFINYAAKTAWIDWDKIGKRWEELENGTIGTVDPNAFPAYTIRFDQAFGPELTDGAVFFSRILYYMVECPAAELFWVVANRRLIEGDVYDQNGLPICSMVNTFYGQVNLKPGLNKLGFYIHAERQGVLDRQGKNRALFIDFKWININCVPLVVSPARLEGEPDKPYQFIARSLGSAPASALYVWEFGDGTGKQSVVNDSTVTHTFSKEGTFTVKVELFDHATNTRITDAISIARILKPTVVPVIDSLGTYINFKNGRHMVTWGHKSLGKLDISIFGKDWLTDPKKTVVKVDGTPVTITNLIVVGTNEYEINPTLITIDPPADKLGKISITVESNGLISKAQDYFVGIPQSVLQKMPVEAFFNKGNLEFINTANENRKETYAYSLSFFKNYNQIESAKWDGNNLTVAGKVLDQSGTNTLNKVVFTFSSDGTKVTRVSSELSSLNLDLEYSCKDLDMGSGQYGTLSLGRSMIPAADYLLISGTVKRPQQAFSVMNFIDGLLSWPNEIGLALEFVH